MRPGPAAVIGAAEVEAAGVASSDGALPAGAASGAPRPSPPSGVARVAQGDVHFDASSGQLLVQRGHGVRERVESGGVVRSQGDVQHIALERKEGPHLTELRGVQADLHAVVPAPSGQGARDGGGQVADVDPRCPFPSIGKLGQFGQLFRRHRGGTGGAWGRCGECRCRGAWRRSVRHDAHRNGAQCRGIRPRALGPPELVLRRPLPPSRLREPGCPGSTRRRGYEEGVSPSLRPSMDRDPPS